MKTAIDLIASERRRQITEKGWTEEHDDQHVYSELSDAAIVYAMHPTTRDAPMNETKTYLEDFWPFRDKFKPSENRIRDLTKAGALIVAEIERLQRQENQAK